MALSKGARRIYDWLKTQKAGSIVPKDTILAVADWDPKSLKAYISKNKLAPFLVPSGSNDMKVLMDGDDVTEAFFNETFTQTAPRRVSLSAGNKVVGSAGEYELVSPLGNGAVGHVWSAKAPGPIVETVAVKIMLPRTDLLNDSKLPNVRERFRREARNGRAINDPGIVKYLDDGGVEGNPFLVMELAQRSIADRLREGAIEEEDAADIVRACIGGLSSLHRMSFVHRDVKPANILEFPDGYKLGDLGIVKWNDFDPAFTHGGTITRQSVQLGSWFYMAPEQQESPHESVAASDIYALGVSWIEMLVGTLPSPHAIGARRYPLAADARPGLAEIISQMLSYDPEERPALADILDFIDRTYA